MGGQDPLLQFSQQSVDIPLACKPHHNVQFLHLDIWRIVVFAEEHPHLVREDVWTLLQEEIDVSQRDPLYFWCGGDEGY
jgi:hypothetical protein